MIVNDDLDELEVLERRYREARGPTSFALTIVTSLGCNFDCPYCFQVKPRAILDDETQQLLLEVLEEQLATIETFGVTWFGGEPLLATDPIYSLSWRSSNAAMRPTWTTPRSSSPTVTC